jgi:hypothetical protein
VVAVLFVEGENNWIKGENFLDKIKNSSEANEVSLFLCPIR